MRAILDAVIQAVQIAGKVLCGEPRVLGMGVLPSTSARADALTCLRESLHPIHPGCGWLTWQTANTAERLHCDHVWIVAPVIGSDAFVQGTPEPVPVLSVALVRHGNPILGAVHNPATAEMFVALRHGGAFLNGRRIFCTEITETRCAVARIGRSRNGMGICHRMRTVFRDIRPARNTAYQLALVAAGRSDLYVCRQDRNEWDVCAGDLLVREAGGDLQFPGGRTRTYNQPDIVLHGGLVAGNEILVTRVLEQLKPLA